MDQLDLGYSILSFPTSRVSYNRRGGYRTNTMRLLSPPLATNIVDSGCDPSGLSITAYALLSINNQKLCFISYYQPIGNDHSGSSTIYARLQHFLHKNNIADNPLAYTSNVASRWTQKFRNHGFTPIIAGDFNGFINAVVCRKRSAISGKCCTHLAAGVPTSSIDHIFIDTSLSPLILSMV